MNAVPIAPALSEEYADIIVRASSCPNMQTYQSAFSSSSSSHPFPAKSPVDPAICLLADSPTAPAACLPAQPVSEQYTILYAPLSDHLAVVEEIGYASVPKLFTEINVVSLEESGILPVRIHSFSEWSGKGVLVGFLDTGIDYTHPAFRNADGTTRILRLWDQADTSGLPPAGISYGTEYTEEDINQALFGGISLANPVSTGTSTSADHFASATTLQSPSVTVANDKSLLQATDPDPRGRGTAVAGIACGSADASEGFTGVAPESVIAFVKIKKAKQYLRDYFRIPEHAFACQEDDLMLGIRYLSDCASTLGIPLVICMSLGSSQGGHTGHTPLEELVNELLYVPEEHMTQTLPLDADKRTLPVSASNVREQKPTLFAHMKPCICTVTGTGNETGLGHHYFGKIQSGNTAGTSSKETSSKATSPTASAGAGYAREITSASIELLIDQETSGFTVEFWPDAPDLYTLSFTSPIGETTPPIRPESGISREFSFLLEKSRILLTWSSADYNAEPGGSQVALIRFSEPTSGIWTIHVGALQGSFEATAPGSFHLWLPVSGLVDPWIQFLTPNADTTLVIPSCASSAITVGAWNAYNNSLYPQSGRGYTRNGHSKPDFTSPGVSVTAPGANGSYTSLTGSCSASALTAGAAALLISAGLRQDPPRYFSSEEIRQFLILGARQRSNENYPNQAWGYGTMDLQNSLNRIRASNTFPQEAYDTL